VSSGDDPSPEAPSGPRLGQPLPRAAKARWEEPKFTHWILAVRGHGGDWTATLGLSADDADVLWELIFSAVQTAPVTAVRDKSRHGTVAEVRVGLVFAGRTTTAVTAWFYKHQQSAPVLVSAYPAPLS
jgi:hypothetical protein